MSGWDESSATQDAYSVKVSDFTTVGAIEEEAPAAGDGDVGGTLQSRLGFGVYDYFAGPLKFHTVNKRQI